MGNGRAEHGHDAVADVLVDASAVLFDNAIDMPEEALQQVMNLLCIEHSAEAGEPGQIGKQHRHLPPFSLSVHGTGGSLRPLRR